MFLTSVCLSFFDPTADNDVFHCKYCKGFHTASRKGVSRVIICAKNLEQSKYQNLLNIINPISKDVGYDIIEASNDQIIPVSELTDDFDDLMILFVKKTKIISFEEGIKIVV